MEQQEYPMVYKSKVVNATIIVENKPNIDLVAKAIIKLAENIEVQNKMERGAI